MKPIIFLDIDGVLNCELHYKKLQFDGFKDGEKRIKKLVKNKKIERLEYYQTQICSDRIKLLNVLCSEIDAEVVISSSWRSGKTVEELKEIFAYCGATFTIIDKTPYTGYERGTEISKWLHDNIKVETHGVNYYDFYKYVIIDDDSDMLLNQAMHFFQTDSYAGLTINTCYKIKRFITKKTF